MDQIPENCPADLESQDRNNVAILRELCPCSPRTDEARILKSGPGAMEIRTAKLLEPGCLVHLRWGSLFLLAEVRACTPAESAAFQASLELKDVFQIPGAEAPCVAASSAP